MKSWEVNKNSHFLLEKKQEGHACKQEDANLLEKQLDYRVEGWGLYLPTWHGALREG